MALRRAFAAVPVFAAIMLATVAAGMPAARAAPDDHGGNSQPRAAGSAAPDSTGGC